jgi:hypothetical protein
VKRDNVDAYTLLCFNRKQSFCLQEKEEKKPEKVENFSSQASR